MNAPISPLMKLRANLREQLKLKRMTAAALARTAGVPKQTVNDWLAGSPPRSIEQVRKIAEVLGITVDALCFGTPDTNRLPPITTDIEALLGEHWIGGLFEIRLRRVKKT